MYNSVFGAIAACVRRENPRFHFSKKLCWPAQLVHTAVDYSKNRNILVGWAALTAVPLCRRPGAHLDNFACDRFKALPLHPRHLGGDHDHLGSLGEGVLAEGVRHYFGTDGETIAHS